MNSTSPKVAVYIMSCDKTADVLNLCIKGLNKYWKSCSFNIYIGTNTILPEEQFKNSLFLPVKTSNWKQETLNQLQLLQAENPEISHLIVFLDDFILNRKVNNERVINICNFAVLNNIKYLRLKRLEEGFLMKFLQLFRKRELAKKEVVFEIRRDHPYFSSLQVAVWDINHLICTINHSDNIWAFEQIVPDSIKHYSVLRSFINYRHIVEKGKWEVYAEKYCFKFIGYFNSGNRSFRSGSTFSNYLTRLRFLIFGYLFLTVRKLLKS